MYQHKTNKYTTLKYSSSFLLIWTLYIFPENIIAVIQVWKLFQSWYSWDMGQYGHDKPSAVKSDYTHTMKVVQLMTPWHTTWADHNSYNRGLPRIRIMVHYFQTFSKETRLLVQDFYFCLSPLLWDLIYIVYCAK